MRNSFHFSWAKNIFFFPLFLCPLFLFLFPSFFFFLSSVPVFSLSRATSATSRLRRAARRLSTMRPRLATRVPFPLALPPGIGNGSNWEEERVVVVASKTGAAAHRLKIEDDVMVGWFLCGKGWSMVLPVWRCDFPRRRSGSEVVAAKFLLSALASTVRRGQRRHDALARCGAHAGGLQGRLCGTAHNTSSCVCA